MKKFFFPFAGKYDLSDHVWHRFAVVTFWVILVGVLWFTYHSLQSPQANAIQACYQTWMSTQPGISLQTLDSYCSAYPLDTGFNFASAVVATLLASYLIQLVYYKILLYIAFGKRLKRI